MEKTLIILISFLMPLLEGFHLMSCHRDNSNNTESISFGAIPSGSTALVYIAQDQRFFQTEEMSRLRTIPPAWPQRMH